MKLSTLFFAAACCATLSGCVVHDHGRHGVHGAKVVVPVPVVVETHTSGTKCPPGQAKKGNC
jgi:hypothetical protein